LFNNTGAEKKHISRGSATPHHKGAIAASPIFDLIHARTQYDKPQPNFAQRSHSTRLCT